MKKQSGITLIALVITIIVLLILAGVTIAAINSNESAPNKAVEARQKNEEGAAKDAATLLVADKIQGYYEAKYVNRTSNAGTVLEYLKENNVLGGDGATTGEYTVVVSDNSEDETTGIITVTKGAKTMATGIVDGNGVITWDSTPVADNGNQQQGGDTNIDWDSIKANATKHASQSQENTDIGIGPSGEAINLDLWEYNIIDGTQTICLGNDRDYMPDYYDICYNGNMREDIILPRSIKKGDTWYDVVEIGIGAFATSIYGQNDPKAEVTITIPDTVTTIDDSAFMYSDYLSYITIPNSVTHIGCQAFCDAEIKKLRISNSVESWESTYNSGSNGGTFPGIKAETMYLDCDLPDYGFDQAIINELILGDNCTSFGEYALNCSIAKVTINCDIPDYLFGSNSLEEVTIGNNCTEIGEYAFSDCYNLQTLNLPNSLTTIGNYAFSGCGIQEISLPNSITTIGEGSFSGCGLTSITIPSSVTSIGAEAFANCSSLSRIEIPSSVTSIGYGVFNYCSSLETITIPNSITHLNYLGYMNETAVINLPSTITHIYYNTFYDGETVNYAGTRAQWNAINLIDEEGNVVSIDDGYELYTDNVTIHCSDD